MRLFTGSVLPLIDQCVVALGMFDGCHNGHLRVLRCAAERAREMGCPCLVWTYASHPMALLAPERAPLPLQSVSQRLSSLEAAGVDAVALRPFTRAEAAVEPEVFLRRLHERMGMRAIALGRSNTFGKNAKGTPVLLQDEGQKRGFLVDIVDTLRFGTENVTSTAVRKHLEEGNMRVAAAMLGRCYALEGAIVPGRKLGREIGFPTINVALPERRLIPKRGVYAGWADVAGGRYPCVLNLGIKPTVGGQTLSLEAFLLDFEGNLYGKQASVSFFQYIRAERRFSNVDQLVEAIRRDAAKAKSILQV